MTEPVLEQVAVDSRAALRAWLEARHAQAESIWLVLWKKGSGPYLPYDSIVEEALCFGWVDSRPAKLDEHRSRLMLSPRKRGSGWSRINKERIKRLLAAGLVAAPGLAVIERAKADGSWSRLDEVETLREPADLLAALSNDPLAGANWARMPPSSRRGILEWIAAAKQPATRAARIAQAAAKAAVGLKANFPAGRDRIAGAVLAPSKT